jgi:hypothetical protein
MFVFDVLKQQLGCILLPVNMMRNHDANREIETFKESEPPFER